MPHGKKKCARRPGSGIIGDVKVCPVCQREYPATATSCTDDGVPLVAMVTDVHGRSEDLVGKIVEGRYKIERIIGKGGMGTVYACRHVVVGKIAAMKVLKAGVDRSDGVLQRFVREAQTANLLKSRHIVEVSDFGQLPNGAFFVVMELLEGQDLAHAMRAGLHRKALVHVFTQIAETLQIAHEKGIVHRDLKPDNVFLVNDGGDALFVKLLDFGIAKILHGEGNGGLTETGVILGTPYYMSPEQARAEAIDHRSDIYALGVMMYRAFTGRLPFMADSTMGVLTRHITEAPQPPSEIGQDIDQATERMILRCLAKKPEYRFQSMREVADALRLVPLDPVPEIREQSTVYEGPRPAPPASSGAYAPYTPQPSGPHAVSMGTSPPNPAPVYAPQPSGPHAAYTPQPSGPHSAYTPQPSGPHAAYTPQPSGAHGMAYAQQPSGPHAAVQSGAYPQAGTSGAYAQQPSGAHVPAVVGMVPGPAATGTMTALHPGNPPPEPTTRGVAATMPAPARASNALLLAVGAASMAAIGAVAAFFLVGRQTAVPAPVAAAPVITVTVTVPAPPPPAPTASATASAAAEPTVAATVAQRPHVAGPARPPPPPPPTATTPPPNSKIPRDIRSPFD
jgi:serine/threonine-protein kinase